MPLVFVEEVEQAGKRLVGNLDVGVGRLQLVRVEQAAVDERDLAEQLFQLGRPLRIGKGIVEEPLQEILVEGQELGKQSGEVECLDTVQNGFLVQVHQDSR